MLRPVVASDGNLDAVADAERLGDRFGARLERVLEIGTARPSHLERDVPLASRQVAAGIAIDPGAGVRLQLTDAVPLKAFGLDERRPVEEVPGHAGTAHETHVGAESFADVHDRVLQAQFAVLPADR